MKRDEQQGYRPNWVSPTLHALMCVPQPEKPGRKKKDKAAINRGRAERRRRRVLKNNPNKGTLRDYEIIEHIANTWEGMIIYSIFGAISLFILLFRVDFTSWEAVAATTIYSPLWLVSAIFFIPTTVGSLRYWIIWFSVLSFDKQVNTVPKVVYKKGVPRQGKSSTCYYEVVLTAKKMWKELRLKYAEYKLKFENKEKLTPEQYDDWKEVKTAYEYCVHSDGVPLLWTNVPVRVGKRYSNILTPEHLAGLKKLPFKCCIYIDEVARFLDEGKSLMHGEKKDWDVSNMFALEGHFLGSVIYASSQDDNAYIDIMRCTLYTEIMNRQEPACKPIWLTGIKGISEEILFEANRKKPHPWRALMYPYLFFKRLWNNVGFRKYNASRRASRTGNNTLYSGREEGSVFGKSRNRTFYLPAKLNCKYDDRAFRKLYPSYYTEAIAGGVWQSLRLNSEDSFLRSTKSKVDILYEKKRVEMEVKSLLNKQKKEKKKVRTGKEKNGTKNSAKK